MTDPATTPTILRLFISYAHEDAAIAIAVRNALQAALGDFLAEIFLDKVSLETGFDFKTQIEEKLESTDILIIIYTGAHKPSHGYTGWEVGYFRGVQRRGAEAKFPRRIVPIYLDAPPATVSAVQGIALGISRGALSATEQDYVRGLRLEENDPMVRFVEELQDIVETLRERGRFPKGQRPDAAVAVRAMLVDIFAYLKTTVDKTLKPQKQVVIRTNVESLEQMDGELPGDAKLVPIGSGSPMSIFGLPEAEITWSGFIAQVSDHKLGDSWRDAITSVVTSSLPNQIDVDNSQIVVSSDESHIYRLILTTSTTYHNGSKEFNLYLVEGLRRTDYGSRDTTLLLKGLEMVCRYRFMFLESTSEFFSKNILAIGLDRVPGLAQRMVKELNLLRRDAREAGLDQPNVWSEYVSWDTVLEMSRAWAPREKRMREVAAMIATHRGDISELEPRRQEFAAVIDDLDTATRAHNRLLIEQMSDRLRRLVEKEH
jgi:TIR domain